METLETKPAIDELMFCILFLGIKPFPYQVDFITDKSREIVWKAARQTGKSLMTAIKSLYNCFVHDGFLVLITAPTLRQSSLIFEKIRELTIKSPYLYGQVEKITQTMIFFKNGSKIYCLPSGDGSTLRGFTSDMIICDEASYIDDKVFNAIEPSLAVRNGTLVLISTPAGQSGKFYEAWISDSFSKHSAKSSDNPLITPEFIAERRKKLDEMNFMQEYEALFVDDSQQLLSMSLIMRNVNKTLKNYVELDGHVYITENPCYMGIDVARSNDWTAISIFEKVQTEDRIVYIQRFLQVIKNEEFPKQQEIVDRILSRFPSILRIRVDNTGLGAGFTEYLKQRHGSKVEGVNFAMKVKSAEFKQSTPIKEKLAVNFKTLLQDNAVNLIDDDLQIRHLSDVDYTFNPIRRSGLGHGDIFWADCLALLPEGFKQGCHIPLITNLSRSRTVEIIVQDKDVVKNYGESLEAKIKRMKELNPDVY